MLLPLVLVAVIVPSLAQQLSKFKFNLFCVIVILRIEEDNGLEFFLCFLQNHFAGVECEKTATFSQS